MNRSNLPKQLSVIGILFVMNCVAILKGQSVSFLEASSSAGISFKHTDGNDSQPYLPALMPAGVAMFDYDGDGWQDVYFLNGHSLDKSKPHVARGNGLYRNLGNGKFVDVTELAGLRSYGYGLGVVTADLDNDGDQDIVISNFGPIQLYQNNGDGTFNDISKHLASPGDDSLFGAGVACLDVDSDGLLDVFAANYVDFTFQRYHEIAPKSFPYPPGPKDFPPSADRLFRNEGNGAFRDVTKPSGISNSRGPSMGVVCGDWDGDDDTDIFVCCDAAPNLLYVNDGLGHFEDMAIQFGLAFDALGNSNGSMGVDAGDYDGDGKEDLLVTNYTGQLPVLYRNLGAGFFEDVSRLSRVGREVLVHTNWGVGLIDFDNDRDLDVFFANGHFLKNIASIDSRTSYRVQNTLMMNEGSTFRDGSKGAGSGFEVVESSRGAVFGDVDKDGAVDIVVLNANAESSFLKNVSLSRGNWVAIKLVGVQSNRDGVGSQVQVETELGMQTQFVHAGRGYQSHFGTVLHFGLGAARAIQSIQIKWPDGKVERFQAHSLDQEYLFVQGTGSKSP